MKHTITMALTLASAAAGLYAQPIPVKMTFSGDGSPSAINLNYPNTNTGEENLAGFSTLGQFTFRFVGAGDNAPQPSTTCSGATQGYFPAVAGGGLFRFVDGSLLKVNITGGGDCIDFATNTAECTRTFQVNGGTGRFQNASGTLNLTETAATILSDDSNPPNPVFFTETGEITGTISNGGNANP